MKSIGKQGSLFTGELEKRISILINNAGNFGVEPEDLGSFLIEDKVRVAPNDHAFSASQHLFDGFNDLEIIYGLPLQVYQSMNTSEIIALFVGDAVMKKFPDIQFQRGKSYSQLKQEAEVEEIVSAMVSVGYKYSAVWQMRRRGYSGHSTNPGDLMKRIAALPNGVKIKLKEALLGSRAVPSRENLKKYDYFDHNIQGHRFGYHTVDSAEVYVNWFMSSMRRVYEKHHKR